MHVDKLAPPNELRVQHAAACSLHELHQVRWMLAANQRWLPNLSSPLQRNSAARAIVRIDVSRPLRNTAMGRLKGRVSLSSGTSSLIFPLRLSRKRKATLAA